MALPMQNGLDWDGEGARLPMNTSTNHHVFHTTDGRKHLGSQQAREHLVIAHRRNHENLLTLLVLFSPRNLVQRSEQKQMAVGIVELAHIHPIILIPVLGNGTAFVPIQFVIQHLTSLQQLG